MIGKLEKYNSWLGLGVLEMSKLTKVGKGKTELLSMVVCVDRRWFKGTYLS